MKDQVLSIEQMQELIELGIDTSKASMCWITTRTPYDFNVYDVEIYKSYYKKGNEAVIPTFTLQDILEMLPKGWSFDCFDDCMPVITIFTNFGVHEEKASTILETAFNMLKWCKQNGMDFSKKL